MTIAPLQPADDSQVAAFVLGIQNGEFHLGFAPHEQPDLLNLSEFYADGGFWVAKIEGVIVGTIGLQRLDERTAILRKMFVQRELRGAKPKVAQQLFDGLLAAARRLGFGNIYLDTPAIATASHRFYQRNGFDKVTNKRTLPAAYRYLAAHKGEGLAEILATYGVRFLYLPPYSPDFNPIELAFSKLKTWLRTAQARTRDVLEEASSTAAEWITKSDAQNWFGHCGYHVH